MGLTVFAEKQGSSEGRWYKIKTKNPRNKRLEDRLSSRKGERRKPRARSTPPRRTFPWEVVK